MAKLDFSGKQTLNGGCAAADVNQVGLEPVFPENPGLIGKPKPADPGGKRAVSNPNGRESGLRVG